MPKDPSGKPKITGRHFIGRAESVNAIMTLTAYGRILENGKIPPRTGGVLHPFSPNESLHHSQVYGVAVGGRCIQLPSPVDAWLPEPDGPADGCGWDPNIYVVWKNLPRRWSSMEVSYELKPLEEILLGGTENIKGDQQLGADQVVQILVDCIPRSGGNNNQVQLSKILQTYGFDDQRQIDVLNSFIVGNSDYGVPAYGFRLSGDALNFVSPSTVLSDIANAIQDKAVPLP